MEGGEDPAYGDRRLEKKKRKSDRDQYASQRHREQEAEVGKWAMRQL